jgi:O-antigen/teichoic acid export membrane protein
VNAKSVKGIAAAGVRWGGIASGLRVALMLARMAVLARLLSKHDFGVATMVTMVLGYAQAYVDLGLSSSLIQKQEREPIKLSTVFWINVLAGVTSAGILVAGKDILASLLKEPELTSLVPLAALALPIAALGQQFEALFHRDLRFKLVAGLQMAADFANTAVAIGMAFAGFGVRSLVVATLVAGAVNSGSLFVLGMRRWPVRFAFRPKEVRSHLRFGAYQLGNANIGYLTSNIDNFLIGRLLGAEALGLYSVALRLTQLPRRYINPVISKVAFPVFAQRQNDHPRLAQTLLSLQRSLSYVNLPLIVGLMLTAPLVVPVLYGDKWTNAAPLVQVLCIVAVIGAIGGPTQIIRTALGHVRFNFYWTCGSGVLYAIGMYLATDYGLTGMVWARTLVGIILGVALVGITLRFIKSGLGSFLSAVREPALAAAAMSAAVFVAMRLSLGLSTLVQLIIAVTVGAVVFFAAALLLDRAFVEKNVRLLLGVKP